MKNFGEELGERRRLRPMRGGREIKPGEFERSVSLLRRLPAGRIVRAPPIGIEERLVRFRDSFVQGLGRAVARVYVRMKPTREPAVRPLDFSGRRAGLQSEKRVEVHSTPTSSLPPLLQHR